MSVPNAPMSTPTGSNHRYGVMRPPSGSKRYEASNVSGEGGALSCAPSADTVAGNGAPLNWRPSADAVTGNEGQGSKQMIVHSRGLCKSPTSPHGVEKHGQNRVRYATVWRHYMLLLVPSEERVMFRKQKQWKLTS